MSLHGRNKEVTLSAMAVIRCRKLRDVTEKSMTQAQEDGNPVPGNGAPVTTLRHLCVNSVRK